MSIWIKELYKNTELALKIKEVIHHSQSQYQTIDIVDTYDWGRVLFLDNCMMLTEKDEFFYHETIAHYPMNLVTKATKVLVLGGGDGGTLRELNKYSQIESIDLVEIDQDVIDRSQQFLPFTASGYQDPRVTVYAQDANLFLQNTSNIYDVIICDGSDPTGFAEILICQEFYKLCQSRLNNDGIFITQSGSPLQQSDELVIVQNNLKQVFTETRTIWSLIPTYPGAYWSFSIASNQAIADIAMNEEIIHNLKFWNQHLIPALKM